MKKKKAKSNLTLASQTKKRNIVSVRDAINQQLKQMGKTRNWLCVKTGIRVATIYRFLAGKQDVTLATAEQLMVAVGLTISVSPDTTPDNFGRSTNRAKLR